VGALAAPAAGQSLVGTLKCTAEAAQAGKTEARAWKVTCTFDPVNGQEQHYTGAINNPGVAPREAGKAFLVWNVLAAKPEVQSAMLVGTYQESKAGANALVGGRNEAIVLQPVNAPDPDRQGDINVAPRVSVMELELPKI
jgi:hypothetical protein